MDSTTQFIIIAISSTGAAIAMFILGYKAGIKVVTDEIMKILRQHRHNPVRLANNIEQLLYNRRN